MNELLVVCPECEQGKCGNCDGTAWDPVTDGPCQCECPSAVHTHE